MYNLFAQYLLNRCIKYSQISNIKFFLREKTGFTLLKLLMNKYIQNVAFVEVYYYFCDK